jgi:hypothetical protein
VDSQNADLQKCAIRPRARDGISRTDVAAVLGQPFLLQTRRIAQPGGGLLIAYGHLVSGGAVLGEWPRLWQGRGIPVVSEHEF